MTIHQGDSNAVTVTLVRGGGFDGAVSLAVSGFPPGVTAKVTPATLTVASGQAQVSVKVDETVARGTYTGTVTASATGVNPASTTYALVVSERPNFTLSATASSLSINQGASATAELRIDRTNFTDGVMLAFANSPAGITGSFGQIPATGTSTILSIGVAQSVLPGTYTLTIVGSAPGHTDKSLTLTIVVTPKPDYTLSVSPGTVSITAGASGQVAVDISRTNFTDAVALALVNLPAGFSGSLVPAFATGNGATLSLNVAGTVAMGTYALTVRGTATGISDRTATVTVSVAPQPAYTLSLSSGSLTADAGASTSVTVQLDRSNFDGDVTLSLANPPAGITSTQVSTSGTRATLTISVAASVTPGSYALTIVASSAGYADRSASLTILVAPRPDFSISLSPSAVTVGVTSATTVRVNIHRTNFAGTVYITRGATPVSISPGGNLGSTTGTSIDIILYVEQTVPGGTYPVTIVGEAAGISGTRTATLTLTVPPPPPTFWLVVSPENVGSHSGGGTQTFNLVVYRISYTGPVTLTVDPVPAGMSVSLDTPVITGSQVVSAQFGRITIPPNTTPGSYTVTIRGTAPGLGETFARLNVGVTSDPPPGFEISHLPSTVNVSAGTSANATVHISRTTSFNGVQIAFSVESAPPGVTGTFNPAVATGNSTALQVAVAPNVAPGTYTMRIRGTGTDVGVTVTRTRDITVVVPTANAFALSSGLQTRTLPQGGQAGLTVTITRTNFTAPVTFSLEGAPPGVTVFFNPNPSSGTSVFVNFTAAGTVPIGTYPVTIRGTSPGQSDQTLSLQLSVFTPSFFTLTASKNSLGTEVIIVYPGGTATSTITLTRTNFTGDVQLSLFALPPEITASIAPTLLSGSTATATLTVTPLPSFVGARTVRVVGQSGSVSTEVSVSVISMWSQYLHFPTVSPNVVTVTQGTSASATFGVMRHEYAGAFSVTVTGAPAGMTVSMNPQPVPAGGSAFDYASTTLTINVGAAVPVGIYTLTARASATGVYSDPATFQVEVKAPH